MVIRERRHHCKRIYHLSGILFLKIVSNTLVIQSHRDPLPYLWLQDCMNSVREWAKLKGFDYRFMGDSLFEDLSAGIRRRTSGQIVIATDLARLYQLQRALDQGYSSVIWCDADFLVFNPLQFTPISSSYAIGREVWVQNAKNGQFKTYVRVHNAFLMFRKGNPFLAFYLETAERLLKLNTGTMPPQFIGPKLLSALHNICRCPVQESAGMLSPQVISGITANDRRPLELLIKNSSHALAAANLCSSSLTRGEVSNQQMQQVINQLCDWSGLQDSEQF
jgi:hypothetical protein